jgi:DNA-binding PadR family transcriptional regulator
MRSGWTDKAATVLNRGFPRIYLLNLLKDKPMTAKEIIDTLSIASEGKWKPSPRNVYPLLAKLVEEDLVYQTDNGEYALTKKGIYVANDVGSVYRTLKKKADSIARFTTTTKNALTEKIKK